MAKTSLGFFRCFSWFSSLSTLHSTPLRSAPLHSTPLHSTPLYSTLLYSTLLYSTPLKLYSTLLYSTLLYSTLLYSTLLHSTPLLLLLLLLLHSYSILHSTLCLFYTKTISFPSYSLPTSPGEPEPEATTGSASTQPLIIPHDEVRRLNETLLLKRIYVFTRKSIKLWICLFVFVFEFVLFFIIQKGTVYPPSKGAPLSQPPTEVIPPAAVAGVALPPALASLLANASGKGEKTQHTHLLLFLSPDWLTFCHVIIFLI